MRVLVIQHDHVSPPGPIGERFSDRGFDVVEHPIVGRGDFFNPGVTTDFPSFTDFDAVVAMGAPWSTYDHGLIGSWVLPEISQLREADRSGVPVMGICFGGQLLATAHGGEVSASSMPELGWTDVESDDDAVVPGGRWFQWHYDQWSLPKGADEIARNGAASQAFVLRRNLALQFHPELNSTMLSGWLDNGGATAATNHGHDLEVLLAESRAWDAEGRHRAHRLVDGFLEHVATRPHTQPTRTESCP